eukprot:NODE_94_length_21525_cov_0.751003.p19 type:complete len:106 gc:universal NODE_94_length_21525_cov_0.751003:450-767(+)
MYVAPLNASLDLCRFISLSASLHIVSLKVSSLSKKCFFNSSKHCIRTFSNEDFIVSSKFNNSSSVYKKFISNGNSGFLQYLASKPTGILHSRVPNCSIMIVKRSR